MPYDISITAPAESVKVEASTCMCGPSGADTGKIALLIVAVRMKGLGQNDSVLSPALLDLGINKTFCTKALITKVGLKDKTMVLSFSTLTRPRCQGHKYCH